MFFYIQYFISYTFTGYIFCVTFSPYGKESGYSLFETFICNGRLYITCLEKQMAKKMLKVDFVALIWLKYCKLILCFIPVVAYSIYH